MKAINLILVLVAVVAVSVMSSVNCNKQDASCRGAAKMLEIPSETIDLVRTFKLYGPAHNPLTCQQRCETVGLDIGFDYYGKQACCCGSFV
jgi:hypothetical protein